MNDGITIPECLAIIVCDDIYRDEITKKLILVGTFNRIVADQFPYTHSNFTVLFTLTEGRGKYDMSLSVENAKTGVTIVDLKGPLTIAEPTLIADFNVSMANITFPEAGKYWICLKVNGTIIKQRPITVQSKADAVKS